MSIGFRRHDYGLGALAIAFAAGVLLSSAYWHYRAGSQAAVVAAVPERKASAAGPVKPLPRPKARQGVAGVATDSASIVFNLPDPTVISVDAFDTEGRHVKNIFKGFHVSGKARFTFEGFDDSDVPVQPGKFRLAAVSGDSRGELSPDVIAEKWIDFE